MNKQIGNINKERNYMRQTETLWLKILIIQMKKTLVTRGFQLQI